MNIATLKCPMSHQTQVTPVAFLWSSCDVQLSSGDSCKDRQPLRQTCGQTNTKQSCRQVEVCTTTWSWGHEVAPTYQSLFPLFFPLHVLTCVVFLPRGNTNQSGFLDVSVWRFHVSLNFVARWPIDDTWKPNLGSFPAHQNLSPNMSPANELAHPGLMLGSTWAQREFSRPARKRAFTAASILGHTSLGSTWAQPGLIPGSSKLEPKHEPSKWAGSRWAHLRADWHEPQCVQTETHVKPPGSFRRANLREMLNPTLGEVN